MLAKKEIIVLNGGGHKGIVKISGVAGKQNTAKVSCSLDFRPSGAKLYLIGDNIAEIVLKDTNCDVEVPFSAKNEIGCVLRSSSLTMFGGGGVKSEMLKKIDAFNRAKSTQSSEPKKNFAPETYIETEDKSEQEQYGNRENSLPKNGFVKDGEQINCEADKGIEKDTEKVAEKNAEEDTKRNAETEKKYVGVASKSDVNPLGEWTKYDGNNFYYAVKPQIDEMFICYPSEDLLSNTVPNSKWVRVDTEDGYYVVGLLFDEDEPSYICYGVPEYQKDGSAKAPAELENMCVWLPTRSEESIAGFWMIYQSAKTGEIIK